MSASSSSDAHVGSSLYLDIDDDGRKLNRGVLGRSTNRRTGSCDGKLWPAEKDFRDQSDVFIRAFPSCVEFTEGPSRAESQPCLDRAKFDSITTKDAGHESEDDGVENDAGSREEHLQTEKGIEKDHIHDEVIENDHEKRPNDEAKRKESEHCLPLPVDVSNCRVTKPSFAIQLPIKASECLQSIDLRGRASLERTRSLQRFSGSNQGVAVKAELGAASRFGFADGAESAESAESADHIERGGGRGKEPQLAERGNSSSHEFFGEGLDVDLESIRDERGALQLGITGSWGDNLRGTQESLSFRGNDTVECITNVGEEDDFGNFDVDEFQTSHRQEEHKESAAQEGPHLETESGKFPATRPVQQSQRGVPYKLRISTTSSATFESPLVTQTEKSTLRTTLAGLHSLPSNKKELEAIRPRLDAADRGSAKIPERVEATGSAGRLLGKSSQESKIDVRVEPGHHQPRKSEVSSSVALEDSRRVRARLDDVPVAESGGSDRRGELPSETTTEPEASTKVSTVVRPSRPSGGKDRHSKVNTAKGPRDRRVRLSVPTAVQFYDVQDRLGYDQPSKAVEWLIKKAKSAIDELGRLPARGSDGPPGAFSDITHSSSPFPQSAIADRPLGSGSSSCGPPGSFSAALSTSPFGDVGNHMSYFIDSSIQQGMSFGNHPAIHNRESVRGGGGLSQALLATGQGHGLTGLSFPLGHTDLSRSNSGCGEGGKTACEFSGSPLARSESRVKARERARERAKEKCSGRDTGTVTGCSSPSSMQSPPLHQNAIHSAYNVPNAMQSSIHSISLQSPGQSALSSVFNTTLSGIIQSSQQGTLQNLIMQNPSLQSPLQADQGSDHQRPFQAPLQTSQSVTSLQDSGMQQQLQMSSMEESAEGALQHLGPGFTPGPCSSSFSDHETSLSSSHYMSLSPHPISRSLSMSQLPAFGMSPTGTRGNHFTAGGITTVPIPPGFSPGPPASAFRPRQMAISHKDQQHLQGSSRPHCQLNLPASASPTRGNLSTSKASAPLYYSSTSSRMGTLQSISDSPLESSSFAVLRNMGYDYQGGLQMMSPGRNSTSGYQLQTASSQSQIPARIQGLSDDFEDQLKSSPPSSPQVHP